MKIDFIYTVKDSENARNNKTFKNDYVTAKKYLHELFNKVWRRYTTYTSDQHEEKIFLTKSQTEWSTDRVLELVTTIEPSK
ncbi:hypothetical protein [Limosilactobacillus antri]|uniref:hypothetical protein n=1 Tax=Limosilactobacillus antri TaxID=227943 RepID=UPI001F59DA54|nr:hypothetical protein [Limosilactobacillus antri]